MRSFCSRAPSQEEPQHLALARRQRLIRLLYGRALAEHPPGQLPGQDHEAPGDGGDRRRKLPGWGIRRHHAPAARRQLAQDGYEAIVVGEEQDGLRTLPGIGFFEGLIPRHHHDVCPRELRPGERTRLSHHEHARLAALEHGP